ncbi:vitamin K epoxide reductase complex subunit 1-like protein 1 [Sapajus apella]|uniref:Vitamin K epoxide reductase complex subunit 1-like protein 1 n=1 Tax=Sapajus apella TaxID=9515 RepID=A0A6J3IL31_SAPAP|nr:vitamin K epoxide reductase complex subunit 1-like protein 1 [Sapajus apella]
MAASVPLRVSVPPWELVAWYAVCPSRILLYFYTDYVEREKEWDPEHRTLCNLGSWVKCSAALASRILAQSPAPRSCPGSPSGGSQDSTCAGLHGSLQYSNLQSMKA